MIPSSMRVAARWVRSTFRPPKPGTLLYHGGRAFDINTPAFYTRDREYAKKFALQHSGGRVFRVRVIADLSVAPTPVWWQNFHPAAYSAWDSVRVQEPIQSLDEVEHESLFILNTDKIEQG